MTAGAKRTAKPSAEGIKFDTEVEAPRPYAFFVEVRTRLGENLEGLEAHGDGISFRSPEPILGGRLIELVICGAILVQAMVVGCAPMPGEADGYWVRARFHNTPSALKRLICEELNRLIADAG
jgi:hypothetical protein